MRSLNHILTLLLTTVAGADPIPVKDGKPNAEIIVSKGATRMQRLAAAELRNHIEEISDAKLEILHAPRGEGLRIFVVRSAHPDKLLFAYAYQQTWLPPEKIERLHPNLGVVLATVWRHKPAMRMNPRQNDQNRRCLVSHLAGASKTP